MTKRNSLGTLLGMPILLALVVSVLLGMAPRWTAHAAGLPRGLPSHVGLGVSAAPDNSGIYGWMPSSGIAWDYAYQYLAGGVNTGGGWETWNSSGQFPLYYAQGANSHGYIPVFPYYEINQSNGSCNSCGGAQKDLANLNNASTMSSYFQNFALLMQRLGSGTYGGITGYGKTAVVQVEPDLSGFAQQAVVDNGSCYGYCTGQGNNPAYLTSSVASSGYSAVAAYPNTYQGFNWALLHLRDLYAPNVLLAIHVSNWATGTDIGSNTSPTVDASTLGQAVGSFAAQSGITGVPAGTSAYDVVFNDVLDRDAAYYKYVYNNPSYWWDRLNVAFPNFHRWETYIGAIHASTGLPIIVWQIPEGNQYFDTDNNTNGHYQDNRAEYFFGHMGELSQVGVIGLLFGAGNGGSTTHSDSMGDGVTNPPSFCTSDGLSSGQICNNHTSSYADDDGGYIRLQAQAYYASLGSATATPTATISASPTATATPAATATPGTTGSPAFTQSTTASPATIAPSASTTIRATITDTGGALSNGNVDVEVYNSAWQKVGQQVFGGQTFGTNQSANYSYVWTAPATPDTFTVMIGVFDGTWTTNYYWDSSAATIAVQANAATPTAAPKPTATATPMPTATATPTPSRGTNGTLGYTTVGAQTDTGDANYLNGTRVTMGSTGGTAISISVFLRAVDAAPANQYQLAIYSDNGGSPGGLVAHSGNGTLVANAWNTLAVSATLQANTSYWLMYNTNASSGSLNNVVYDDSSTILYAYSASGVPFGTWPTTFGSANVSTMAYSIYVTYTH